MALSRRLVLFLLRCFSPFTFTPPGWCYQCPVFAVGRKYSMKTGKMSNWGASVEVFLTKEPGDFNGVPAHQLGILSRMQLPISPPGSTAFPSESSDVDLVVDGVIGYSLSGAPRGQAAEMIRWANGQRAHILALDAPSGLDTATGEVFDPAIKATATLTLALPKQGLRTRHTHVGELYLADISVPPALYKQSLGLEVGPLFAESDVVRLE